MIKKFGRIGIFLMLIGMLTLNVCGISEGDYDYILDYENSHQRNPIPKSYLLARTISNFGQELGELNNVQDLFVDEQDNLYIVDTGNSRIIKCDGKGNLQGIFTGSGKSTMKNPEGIYVYSDGDMFVADTANNRILHLDAKGNFVEEFLKPESNMLEPEFVYNPRKVVVTSTGYLYSIKYQSLMQVDANNSFRGYVGSTSVGYNPIRMIINMFATESQKSKMEKVKPQPYTNFILGKDGMFYATTLDYSNGQIKKLNTTGDNIYTVQSFGEDIVTKNGYEHSIFEDIAVDTNGIITVVDRISARVYQYDQEGNLLTVFGGKGTDKDDLLLPKCVEIDTQGNIYVYDTTRNDICVFEPTKFISSVHKAVTAYNTGDYNSALTDWETVLSICETYGLAHEGIGKTYYKKAMYTEAMQAFEKADNKEQYTRAFDKQRYLLIKNKFPLLVLIGIALLVLLYYGVKYLNRLSFICERNYMKKRKGGY